jgi:tRNA modification GTPase
LKQLYEGWRGDIIKCRALTEAIIDFGEDDEIEDEVYEDGIPLTAIHKFQN